MNTNITNPPIKIILSILILISIVWSYFYTFSSVGHVGMVYKIGELVYLICFIVSFYGFIPLVIIEILSKERSLFSKQNIIFYLLAIVLILSYFLDRNQDWIMD